MVIQCNIYGRMQLETLTEVILKITVHAPSFLVHYHHLLFVTSTTVNLVLCTLLQVISLVTLYGMVRAVPVKTIAVLNQVSHGSIVRFQ